MKDYSKIWLSNIKSVARDLIGIAQVYEDGDVADKKEKIGIILQHSAELAKMACFLTSDLELNRKDEVTQ